MSPSGAIASAEITGPIEQSYRERSAAFRAASDSTRLSRTHWHIAIANGLGWGFDGMDGVIFALATPLVIKDFGVTLPEYRSGLQIALLVGILGMYVWPWLADRYGRRTLLAVNIALFSLLMPIAALTTTFAAFVAVRSAINFALNGEWSLGSMLVAETWPAHMRGRVIGINRGTWCFGAALAGAIATFIIAEWGWRIACVVPAVVALLAVYVRMGLPESPYWVRLQDRKRRVREAQAAGRPLLSADQAWLDKAAKIPVRQLFLPDMLRQHCGRDVHRLLQHDHLRHGRRLDAAVSRARAALVDRDVRYVLYLVGAHRLSRPVRGGTDLRSVRTQAGILCHAG